LKIKVPAPEVVDEVQALMRDKKLVTVCEEARCPNLNECWGVHRTATFMLMGEICTRHCGFCSVGKGKPGDLDPEEPQRVAEAVASLKLKFAVVTSVNRDDLPDGGAAHFAQTIRWIRSLNAGCGIEVLIPDFQGSESSLRAVLDARPDVLNHNTETVPRLFRSARPGGRYERTLELLDRARTIAPDIPTKSGIMVGLGEEWDEIVEVLTGLRKVGCSILTIGQYLRPSQANLPMVRYYHPDEFAELKRLALELGFLHAECGPLVRSSYHAHEQTAAYDRARAAGR